MLILIILAVVGGIALALGTLIIWAVIYELTHFPDINEPIDDFDD